MPDDEGDYLCNPIKHALKETEELLVEGLENGTTRSLDMAALRKRAEALLKQEKAL